MKKLTILFICFVMLSNCVSKKDQQHEKHAKYQRVKKQKV